MQQLLSEFVPTQIFAFMLIFTRVGSAIMLLPGLGEPYVNPRFRLSFAVLFTMILLPVIGPKLPPMPQSGVLLVLLIIGECLIGIFFGVLARLIITSLEIAGMAISSQLGLSAAMMFNPVMGTQGSLVSVFLTLAGVGLIFLGDVHHVLLRGVIETYTMMQPGQMPVMEDVSMTISKTVSESFKIGIQLSAPFLVLGLVFYVGLGLVSRLMPQMQIFFIAVPLQIVLGLMLLIACFSAIMAWYLDYMTNTVQAIFYGG